MLKIHAGFGKISPNMFDSDQKCIKNFGLKNIFKDKLRLICKIHAGTKIRENSLTLTIFQPLSPSCTQHQKY